MSGKAKHSLAKDKINASKSNKSSKAQMQMHSGKNYNKNAKHSQKKDDTDPIKEAWLKQNFDELKISNDFIFCKVARNLDICQAILRILLPKIGLDLKDASIIDSRSQEEIKNSPLSRAIRLDVFATDSRGTSYDIEMQMLSSPKLIKRIRLYQSVIDNHKSPMGLASENITDTVVIFFCMQDARKDKLPIHTHVTCCLEKDRQPSGDGRFGIEVWVPGWKDIEEGELKELMKYLDGGEPTTQLTQRMQEEMLKAKTSLDNFEEYKSMYMRIDEAMTRGFEKGIEEGRIIGIKEGVQQGKIEGMQQGIVSTARRMKEAGADIAFISQTTTLAPEEIAKL